MSSMKRRSVTLFAAIIGGSAVVTIGVMSAAVTADPSGQEMAKGTTMTIGATSTETTPANAPGTAQAVPAIKGPAPLFAGEDP
jgi:hypothetical protein